MVKSHGGTSPNCLLGRGESLVIPNLGGSMGKGSGVLRIMKRSVKSFRRNKPLWPSFSIQLIDAKGLKSKSPSSLLPVETIPLVRFDHNFCSIYYR